MLGLADLPVPLRRYLLAVCLAGPVAVVVTAVVAAPWIGRDELGRAALLLALAAIAERFSIRLSHRTTITVSNAA